MFRCIFRVGTHEQLGKRPHPGLGSMYRIGVGLDTSLIPIHAFSYLYTDSSGGMYLNGSSVHMPSFSETYSPWTVCTFGVIPEQGKKMNQNSLFHSSTAKRAITSILVNL
jgi:hypothetical protein